MKTDHRQQELFLWSLRAYWRRARAGFTFEEIRIPLRSSPAAASASRRTSPGQGALPERPRRGGGDLLAIGVPCRKEPWPAARGPLHARDGIVRSPPRCTPASRTCSRMPMKRAQGLHRFRPQSRGRCRHRAHHGDLNDRCAFGAVGPTSSAAFSLADAAFAPGGLPLPDLRGEARRALLASTSPPCSPTRTCRRSGRRRHAPRPSVDPGRGPHG